jgi:bacteriorhodopsin
MKVAAGSVLVTATMPRRSGQTVLTGVAQGKLTELAGNKIQGSKCAKNCGGLEGVPPGGAKCSSPTVAGKVALWVVAAIMGLSTLFFFYKMWQMERKYFHAITCLCTGFATIAYLTMASDGGMKMVGCRVFYYARYLDWTVTTPLLLLDLMGIAGATFDLTCTLVGVDVLMIVAGLCGAMAFGAGKWLLWLFGMVMFAPIVYQLAVVLQEKAKLVGKEAQAVFQKLAWLTVGTWAGYPLVWLLAEGLRVISVDLEIFCYAFLDVAAKAVFGFILVMSHEAIDEVLLGRNYVVIETPMEHPEGEPTVSVLQQPGRR